MLPGTVVELCLTTVIPALVRSLTSKAVLDNNLIVDTGLYQRNNLSKDTICSFPFHSDVNLAAVHALNSALG